MVVGCGSSKYVPHPNIQKVNKMTKESAVSYLNSLNFKDAEPCIFKTDYMLLEPDTGLVKKYEFIHFLSIKEGGNQYRLMLSYNADRLILCSPSQGTMTFRQLQDAVNALDKLGIIIE